MFRFIVNINQHVAFSRKVVSNFEISRMKITMPNSCWIIEKAIEFQKNIYFCFTDYAKAFDCVDHNKLWKILKEIGRRPPDLTLEKCVSKSRNNN